MGFLKVFGFIVLGIISLLALFILFIRFMGYYSDKRAISKGRKYCEARGYTFKKVEAYPNHYGLFFIKEGMHFYASFDYERDGSFTWKKGSPEDKIAERLRKKELRALEKLRNS